MQYKSVKTDVVDIDEAKNTVVVYYAAFNNKDRAGDIIVKSAFNKTIKDRGPAGSDEIWQLFNHNSNYVVGKPIELSADDYGLKAVTKLIDTNAGRDAIEMYKAGVVKHHSIGYDIVREQSQKGYNELQELRLYEGSHVLWPANPKATTVSVDLKSLEIESYGDILDIIKKFSYFCKNSKATDETIEIIEKSMKQLEFLLTEIKGTLPEHATEPLNENLVKALDKFNNLFKK